MAQIVSLRKGRFDKTNIGDLTDAFGKWDSQQQRLVLHFHGGLVSHEAGLATAERLGPLYEKAGAYPLFVLWQSAAGEVIVNNLRDIANERIFKRLLLRVVQFVVGKLEDTKKGSRGLTVNLRGLDQVNATMLAGEGGEPFAAVEGQPDALSKTEEAQLVGALDTDPVIRSEAEKIASWLNEEDAGRGRERGAQGGEGESEATLMSPEVLEEIRAEGSRSGDRALLTTARLVKGGVVTVGRVLKRFREGRDHGVFTTSVEELLREFYLASVGRAFWGAMKRDTADAFGADPNAFGGTAILGQLAARDGWAAQPVLVGHSAGSVYICNFLAHADATLPEHVEFDVVMLAPACDFRLMDKTLSKHGKRIRRLRIFAMTDENESKDSLLRLVYPRSLLYLVSGVLEKDPDWPLLGMERFHRPGAPYENDDFPEIERVRKVIDAMPDSTVWSVASGGGGLASSATTHGAFDDDHVTLASVCEFIATP